MTKSYTNNKVSIYIGWNWKRVALGFSIDKWGINLDLGPVWVGVEW